MGLLDRLGMGSGGAGPNPFEGLVEAPAPVQSASAPAPSSAPSRGSEVENYIRNAAAQRGMDPDKIIRVVNTEGGTRDPYRKSEVIAKNGKREESYGPFQMYFGGGLGNKALAEAGIDARRDWKAGVDYALDYASKNGWGEWYGPQNAGLPLDYGLKGSRATGAKASDPRPEAVAGTRGGATGGRGSGPSFPATGTSEPVQWAGVTAAPDPTPTKPNGLLGLGGRAGGLGGIEGGSEASAFSPPEGRSPTDFAVNQYKIGKTTKHLRALGPAATLDVLTALGQSLRAPKINIT